MGHTIRIYIGSVESARYKVRVSAELAKRTRITRPDGMAPPLLSSREALFVSVTKAWPGFVGFRGWKHDQRLTLYGYTVSKQVSNWSKASLIMPASGKLASKGGEYHAGIVWLNNSKNMYVHA